MKNENKKRKKKEIKGSWGEKFKPPTIEEVKAYCLERKNTVDPNKWHDHYTSNGWMVGKNKMKDWKAAVRTWERNSLVNNSAPIVTRGSGSEALDNIKQWEREAKERENASLSNS